MTIQIVMTCSLQHGQLEDTVWQQMIVSEYSAPILVLFLGRILFSYDCFQQNCQGIYAKYQFLHLCFQKFHRLVPDILLSQLKHIFLVLGNNPILDLQLIDFQTNF
uniref:Uncharacterized protein n=1 Tax=Cacopsylla melanoneura TaxID=428564 RepID=A0A8D9EWB9_9HEMI